MIPTYNGGYSNSGNIRRLLKVPQLSASLGSQKWLLPLSNAVVNTIVPPSPFFGFCTPKYPSLQASNKIRLNICLDEMAPFGRFAAINKAKQSFDSGGSIGGLPTRPARYECVHHWQTWFRRRFRVFSYSSWCVIGGGEISRNCQLECRSLSGQARGKPCVSCLRRSEVSAQVRPHKSYTSYSQGYSEGFPMASRPQHFLVRWGRRSRYPLIGCAPIGAKPCLRRSNTFHSRHTTPSSSSNCR